MRIISVGVPVDELLANPDADKGLQTSVEFCGGTHLQRTGHIGDFVIVTEEAIAKGIRRIVALTGPEAKEALDRAENYRLRVAKINEKKNGEYVYKILLGELNAVFEELARATIPVWQKEKMQNELTSIKKELEKKDKENKAEKAQKVLVEAKTLVEQHPDLKIRIYQFDAGNNAKALDAAIKQIKSQSPNSAVMLFSVDEDEDKLLVLSSVPEEDVGKGLKANEWIQQLSSVINGKGGGKELAAQATGTNIKGVVEAMEIAKKFAELKLNGA